MPDQDVYWRLADHLHHLGMPADEDTEGLTAETLDMMEHSVLISGQIEDESTGEETVLLARIWEILECEMLFDRPLVFEGPVLESVSIQIDQRTWFDGIDFALQGSAAVHQRITENVRSSLRAALSNWGDDL